MKKNLAIIALIITVIAITAGFGFYFIHKNKTSINSVENIAPSGQFGTDNQANSEQPQNKLVTDDFEINLPEGWRKTEPTIGVSAMAVKADEKLNNPAAQKINFRSYFAVSYDTLQGKNLNEYLRGVQNQLQQTISGVVFAQEHDTTINGKPARAFEASFTQREVSFKTLMVAVKGVGDDVWIMSFNTLQSTWDEYRQAFSDIANSFSFKL